MLKKITIRKITLTSMLVLLLALLTLFPEDSERKLDLSNKQAVEYTNSNTMHEIFLVDKDNYVARTTIILKSTTVENKIRELLESLIIGGKKESNIPNGFRAIIPVDTKILGIDLKEGILKINFSKEILEIDSSLEEKMIEAITYTLTGIDEVKGILIYVEGELLNVLPKSKVIIPSTLTREFGINKAYDITSNKDITSTTIYYVSKHDDDYYYVPVTKITNLNTDKIKIIIDELTSGPIYQSNLMSFLNSNVDLLDYEIKEGSMILKFNDYILDDIDSNKILEEVKYSISLSIKDNYTIDNVIFMVGDVEIAKSVIKTLE
jgi:germination protein M